MVSLGRRKVDVGSVSELYSWLTGLIALPSDEAGTSLWEQVLSHVTRMEMKAEGTIVSPSLQGLDALLPGPRPERFQFSSSEAAGQDVNIGLPPGHFRSKERQKMPFLKSDP